MAILTPRNKEKGPNRSLWDTTLVKVNAFTAEELPLFDPPLSHANFSIGEDQSLRTAIEAKWSPPGLAIHKGCALAVLSANHVLSIWAPIGRSTLAENWTRQVMVNDAVAEYYKTKPVSQQNSTAEPPSQQQLRERARVSQRIRSFAWSHSLVRHDCDDGHYLAVSTEGGDILFLRAMSPHCRATAKPAGWVLTVVGTLHLDSDFDNPFRSGGSGVRFAESLSWDEWAMDAGGHHVAQFAYVHAGRLFTTSIKQSKPTIGQEQSDGFIVNADRRLLIDRADVTGPVRFSPGDQRRSLVAFGDDTVFQVDVNCSTPIPRTHHLDGRWDKVSGAALTNPGNSRAILHVTSLLSMSMATTTTLSLPINEDETSVQPLWQHAISESKATFGAGHDLGGNVLERTSGIVSSPLGDYVATCTTMHPSDCIEYVIGSEQKSVLNITRESEQSEVKPLSAPQFTSLGQRPTTEAILFSLIRQVEREEDTGLDNLESISRDSLVAEVLQHTLPSQDGIIAESTLSEDLSNTSEALYHHMKRCIFAHPDTYTAQASRIADIALKPSVSRAEVVRPVVQRLVQEFLKMTNNIDSTDSTSQRITATFNIVNARLMPNETTPVNGDGGTGLEDCKICQKPIPFESLRWARCNGGHQFSRCSLSLLPVQEPGTTKNCGICGLQYFNEKIIGDVEAATGDVEMADVPTAESNIDIVANDTWVEVSRNPNAFPQQAPTLAQILFDACDVCVYCGGKFVD